MKTTITLARLLSDGCGKLLFSIRVFYCLKTQAETCIETAWCHRTIDVG